MGIALPLPPRDLKKIAVIGDTGCRINFDKNKNQYNVQDCKNDWPFAKIARKVADEQPDVVIHVGDYHYREVPCPENKQKECGGSPYGNNWPTWQADFFTPAAPLLQAAPWVFVRGNHEDCKRAGWGWLRLLDLGPLPSVDCNENPAPYAVKLPGLQLRVRNTAAAGAEPASFYKTAYEEINQLAAASSEPSWLLSHHPLWAFVQPENKPLIPLTEKLQEASGNNLDANVKLVLAGHIHLFEALAFAPSPPRAPSIVAGMSGTELDPKIETPLVDQPISGTTVSQASTSNQFAYAILEPKDKGWRMTVHDVNGKAVMVCEIAGEALGCKGM